MWPMVWTMLWHGCVNVYLAPPPIPFSFPPLQVGDEPISLLRQRREAEVLVYREVWGMQRKGMQGNGVSRATSALFQR